MAGLLHLAEEVQGAAGDRLALRQAGPGIIQFLPAEHKLLKIRKKEKDELRPLIDKYKNMISGNQGGGGVTGGKIKKPKRTKWYTE